jgi:hypothetical protein
MRTGHVSLIGLGAALTVVLALGGFGMRTNDAYAQPKSSIVTSPQLAALITTLCEQNCDQKYNTCLMGQAINEVNERIEGVPGFKPGKSPRRPLPYDFGFGFVEENAPPKKAVNPAPSCSTQRNACLAKCGVKP